MTSFLSLMAGLLLGLGGPVTGLRIQPALERTEVVISMQGQAEYRDFTMEGPSRLVVDLMGAQHALPQENFLDIHRGGVRSIRTSQYSSDIVRVVVELDAVVGYEILPEQGELRLVLENHAGAFAPWSTAAAAPIPEVLEPAPAPMLPAPQEEEQRISITFSNASLSEVLFAFADFADRSIVPGDVEATVTAEIRDQPWDVALEAILSSKGLVARETDHGIILVDDLASISARESTEPMTTRTFNINFAKAAELESSVTAFLSQPVAGQDAARSGGQIAVNTSTNTIIVTDVSRVLDRVEALIEQLDKETPQVAISAKIIFINRTDLQDFGVTYDLKDSRGNQLNVLTPGATDMNGDGVISMPEDRVEVGTDVISLGGNSVAALGNARARIPNPNLTLLSSLIVGRHTLISFVEALESMNLSEVQAEPYEQVLNNHQARIHVGEETPIRIIEAQAGAQGGGSIPMAQVEIKETGIILEATPQVTDNGKILLDLMAERSAAIPAEADAGFIFQTQRASSRVLVDDGETVVIAGLTVTETSEVRSGIPLLMDIPLIGRLFRVTRESRIQRDLMILVTPTIVRGSRN